MANNFDELRQFSSHLNESPLNIFLFLSLDKTNINFPYRSYRTTQIINT